MFKKFCALLFACLLLFGCGNKNDDTVDNDDNDIDNQTVNNLKLRLGTGETMSFMTPSESGIAYNYNESNYLFYFERVVEEEPQQLSEGYILSAEDGNKLKDEVLNNDAFDIALDDSFDAQRCEGKVVVGYANKENEALNANTPFILYIFDDLNLSIFIASYVDYDTTRMIQDMTTIIVQ